MIINVMGGCGSGKSTLVRTLANEFGRFNNIWAGQKKPAGRVFTDRGIFVPGHYEIANGGIDTIGNLQFAYDLIEGQAKQGIDVLYEGMNQKTQVQNILRLNDKYYPLEVVLLTTTLEDCVASVRQRGHTRHEDYIAQTHRKALRDADRLFKSGIKVFHLDRARALSYVRERMQCE